MLFIENLCDASHHAKLFVGQCQVTVMKNFPENVLVNFGIKKKHEADLEERKVFHSYELEIAVPQKLEGTLLQETSIAETFYMYDKIDRINMSSFKSHKSKQ